MRLRARFEVGGFIDDDGRIARAGADGALAGLHRRGDDGGAAGDAEQPHLRVLAHRVEGLERRLHHGGEQVGDADLLEDRLVVSADRDRRALCRRRGAC